MPSSSPNSPRSRLGRLFHRRAASNASSEASPKATAPAADGQQPNAAFDTGHLQRRSSKRSLRDYVQGSGISTSRSGSRRIALQREQLNREPLPSGAEVAAAKALYPDGNWAPVSPTDGHSPLGGPQAQAAKPHQMEESRGPPIHEAGKSRPTTANGLANGQSNGQPTERMLVKQQQGRWLEHEYRQDVAGQASVKPAPVGRPVTTTTTTSNPTSHSVTTTTTTRINNNRRSRHVTAHSQLQNGGHRVGGLEDFPDPLKVTKSRSSSSPEAARASLDRPHRVSGQLAHKPDVSDPRNSVDSDVGYGIAIPPRISSAKHSQEARRLRSSSLQKPLPEPPAQTGASYSRAVHQPNHASPRHHDPDLAQAREHGIQNASAPIDLTNIVDLRNTEDTTHHTTYAPAVTHETIIVEHHEEIQEILTRETHNHHIFHRILPVIDFEVLPPRHFIETRTGGKYEISPDIVPPETNEAIQTLIHDAVAKLMPKSTTATTPAFPTRFSARTFHGSDGDPKEWTGPYGEPRTEQWWVHPPTWETGGRDTGQTEPFHLGSRYEEDDGLRTPLPDDTSKWPQQLRRASLRAAPPPPPPPAGGKASVQATPRPRSGRLSQEYQDYRIYQDAIEQRVAAAAPPPLVPRHRPGAHTVLPIRMQYEAGQVQEGARF